MSNDAKQAMRFIEYAMLALRGLEVQIRSYEELAADVVALRTLFLDKFPELAEKYASLRAEAARTLPGRVRDGQIIGLVNEYRRELEQLYEDLKKS